MSVADIAGRARLRSAERHEMLVPRSRIQLCRRRFHVTTSTVGDVRPWPWPWGYGLGVGLEALALTASYSHCKTTAYCMKPWSHCFVDSSVLLPPQLMQWNVYFQPAELSCGLIGHTCPIRCWKLLCFWNATLISPENFLQAFHPHPSCQLSVTTHGLFVVKLNPIQAVFWPDVEIGKLYTRVLVWLWGLVCSGFTCVCLNRCRFGFKLSNGTSQLSCHEWRLLSVLKRFICILPSYFIFVAFFSCFFYT